VAREAVYSRTQKTKPLEETVKMHPKNPNIESQLMDNPEKMIFRRVIFRRVRDISDNTVHHFRFACF